MKTQFLQLFGISLIFPLSVLAQTKTCYDREGQVVNDTANFAYCIETTPQKNGWTYVKKFNEKNILSAEGAYSVYTDTTMVAEGLHKNYRWENGELWYTEEYKSGKRNKLQSYYSGGKLKRVEQYDKKGELKSGKCYNEDGSKREYTAFNIPPAFPGGIGSLMSYLAENIQYPALAKENNIQGTVAVSFAVMKDGSIGDVQMRKGIGGGCDEESVRVVQAMSRWSPGLVDDEPVKVRYTLPINFKLE